MIKITIETDNFHPMQFNITRVQMNGGIRKLFTKEQLTDHFINMLPDDAVMRVILDELFSLDPELKQKWWNARGATPVLFKKDTK